MFNYVKYVPKFPTYGEEMRHLISLLNQNDIGMSYRDAMRAWVDFSQSTKVQFAEINEPNVVAFIEWLRTMEEEDLAFFQEWNY